jgi:hypothetical protein
LRKLLVRLFCTLPLLVTACGGGAETEPTRTTTSATVSTVEPIAGTALPVGTAFRLGFTIEYAQDAFTLYTVAFVRDDGVFSPPVACGGGGSSGGAFAGQPLEVSGVLGPLPTSGGVRTDSQRFGNILYQFAKGRRVNAVLLLKRLPGPPTGSAAGCVPLGTTVPGFTNVTEGTVFPENADQRVNLTLNWFIQE